MMLQKSNALLPIFLTAGLSCLLGQLFLFALPWHYIAAFFVLFGFIIVFIRNQILFLGLLFTFRAGIDSFLVNVRFSIGGVDLGLGGVFALIIIVLAGFVFLIEKDDKLKRRIAHPLIKIYVLFCFFSVINSLYSFNHVEAYKVVLRNFSILALSSLVILKVRNERDAFFLFKSIACSILPCFVIGALTGVSMYHEIRGLRYCATLSHPNILAYYLLVIMACFLTAVHLERDRKWDRIFTAAGIVAILGMLLLTKTRSGYAAFLLLFLVYSWFNNRRLILPIILTCSVLMFFPVVSSSLSSLYHVDQGRITLNRESSFSWRLEKWGFLMKEAVKKPVIGHGMGAANRFGKDALAAHNVYVQFFLESGVVGLILYFSPYFYLLGLSLKLKRVLSRDSLLYRICNFFLIFLPPFLIMSISENLSSYVIIQWYLWAIIAIFICLAQGSKRAEA